MACGERKAQFSVDGKDGKIVVFRRNRRKRCGPSWGVSLYSSTLRSDGRRFIFNGPVDKKSLSILKIALSSTDMDVAYNWLVRIAMEKRGVKAFREWLTSRPEQMFGSGYIESCIKYTPLVIVRGGLPS